MPGPLAEATLAPGQQGPRPTGRTWNLLEHSENLEEIGSRANQGGPSSHRASVKGFLRPSGAHTHVHTRWTRDFALVPRPSYQGGRGPPSMEALACLGLPEAAVPGAKQGHDGLCIPCGSGEGSLAARAREQARPPSTCSLGAHAVFGAGLAAPPTSLQTGFGGRVRPLVAARRQRKARVLQEHRLSRVTASHPADFPGRWTCSTLVWGARAGPPSPCTAAAPGVSLVRGFRADSRRGLVHRSSQARSPSGALRVSLLVLGPAGLCRHHPRAINCLSQEADNEHFRCGL